MEENKLITVTSPLLPNLADFNEMLQQIWDSKWITNNGSFHKQLEKELASYLKVPYISLFTNGTLPLITALQALRITGEVITTPYSFVATTHSLWWNGCKPVFVDIDPATGNIDPDKIEAAITPQTQAIMPVHVYGKPCDTQRIQEIADKYGLKVIYDAAHAFSTEINGRSIGTYGDITMYSFHATKLYNSVEGGCLTYNNPDLVRKIYNLRNFGIRSEELVEEVGINGKMNEIQAAIGLLNLELFEKEQEKRSKVKSLYDNGLKDIKGIRIPKMPSNTTNSYQYYPIVIEDDYALTRNQVYEKFKELNILTRKYFYPACHDYECYKNDLAVKLADLSIVNDLKNKVLCLPYYGDLEQKIIEYICEKIQKRFN